MSRMWQDRPIAQPRPVVEDWAVSKARGEELKAEWRENVQTWRDEATMEQLAGRAKTFLLDP